MATYSRTPFMNLIQGPTATKLDGARVATPLQGTNYMGTLRVTPGTATIVFDTPGAYFGEDEFVLVSPEYNNGYAHVLEKVTVLR